MSICLHFTHLLSWQSKTPSKYSLNLSKFFFLHFFFHTIFNSVVSLNIWQVCPLFGKPFVSPLEMSVCTTSFLVLLFTLCVLRTKAIAFLGGPWLALLQWGYYFFWLTASKNMTFLNCSNNYHGEVYFSLGSIKSVYAYTTFRKKRCSAEQNN